MKRNQILSLFLTGFFLTLGFNNCSKRNFTAIDEKAKFKTISQESVLDDDESVIVDNPVLVPGVPVRFICSNKESGKVDTNLTQSQKALVDVQTYVAKKSGKKVKLELVETCRDSNANVRSELMAAKSLSLKSCQTEGELISKNEATGEEQIRAEDGEKFHSIEIKNEDGTSLISDKRSSLFDQGGEHAGSVPILFDVNGIVKNAEGGLGSSGSKENQELCDIEASPLFVDMRGAYEKHGKFSLTAPWAGVRFDILGENADPVAHSLNAISWFKTRGLGYIALPNAEGKVLGINELFGDNTKGPDGKFAANGYAALAKYDDDSDNMISEVDAVYSKLRIWEDRNNNGKSESNELSTLAEAEITVIDLRYDASFNETDRYGNAIKYKSVAKTASGEYKLVFDVWFELNHLKARANSQRKIERRFASEK